MALPAFTPDMPAVLDLGVYGRHRRIVLGSLKTCAEAALAQIGEPDLTFRVVDRPGEEPRKLTRAEILKVVGAYG